MGIIGGGGTGFGGSFNESPLVLQARHASLIDSYVPGGGGGPFVYNESPLVKQGRHADCADTLLSGVYNEFPLSLNGRFAQTAPIGTAVYNDSPTANLARFALTLGRAGYAESLFSVQARQGACLDTYIPNPSSGPFFEFPIVSQGRRSAASDALHGSETVAAILGRHAASLNTAAFTGAVLSRSGRSAGSFDSYANGYTVLAKHGRSSASLDRARLRESVFVLSGRQIAAADIAHFAGRPLTLRGRHGGETGSAFFIDSPIARHARFSASGDRFSATDSPQAHKGRSSASPSVHKVKESPLVFMARQVSMSQAKGFAELVAARRAMRPAAIDQMITFELCACSRGRRASSHFPLLDSTGLIPAIRSNTNKALPNLTQIVEALPDADTVDAMIPDYAIILAHEPTPEAGWAVQMQAVRVQVDILLVRAQASGVDQPQAMRSDLDVLVKQLLADYHQLGASGVPSATDTNLVSTPLERANTYRQHFAGVNRPLEVMVITMEFLIVRRML